MAPGNFGCTPVTSKMRPSASLNVTPIRSRSLKATVNLLFKRSQELNDIGCKNDALATGDESSQGVRYPEERSSKLVNRAVILVVRFRHIGRGARQAEWVNENGGGFADGRFDRPSGDYNGDCDYRDAEQSAHVRSPLALQKRALALE
jgi:hypothetical protein